MSNDLCVFFFIKNVSYAEHVRVNENMDQAKVVSICYVLPIFLLLSQNIYVKFDITSA